MISATIITYNEEATIQRCIKSLKGIAQEVIVVDSLSTDNTVPLAKSLGARVVKQEFLGHVAQKNHAVSESVNDWIISLDADEVLSKELRESIMKIDLNKGESFAYSMNRRNWYCDRWMFRCGWYPDRKLRLWNRKYGRWGGLDPHDKVIMDSGSNSIYI